MQPANDNQPPLADDLLIGAAAIAAFSGFQRRQVYHMATNGTLPVFRAGEILCSRKSALTAWADARMATKVAA
jgi:hypothetical protein